MGISVIFIRYFVSTDRSHNNSPSDKGPAADNATGLSTTALTLNLKSLFMRASALTSCRTDKCYPFYHSPVDKQNHNRPESSCQLDYFTADRM